MSAGYFREKTRYKKEANQQMSSINSYPINLENNVFSVLNTFEISLFPTYAWKSSDIVQPNVFGASFTAYNRALDDAVANISIVDVTDDQSDPKISDYDETNLPVLDALLLERISTEIDVIEWRSSKFREMYSTTVLVTNFMAKHDGKDWQYSSVRMSHLNRNYAIWSYFEFPAALNLAYPIFEAIKSLRILKP